MHLPRRRWRRLVPSITPASCTEEVASSRTYLEPARRIKARPTGLRLQRSRRAATCSTYLTLLLFSSISILSRRYFTRSYSLFLGVRMAVGVLGCEMDRTHRPDSVDHESQRCLWYRIDVFRWTKLSVFRGKAKTRKVWNGVGRKEGYVVCERRRYR